MMRNHKKFLSFVLILCITLTSFSFSFAQQNNGYERFKVIENGAYINNKYYTQEEFNYLLDNAEVIEIMSSSDYEIAPRSAIAATAGTYIIAGIGKVVITELGKVVVAGVTVKAGSWVYNSVMEWFEGRSDAKYQKLVDSIPSRFRNGNVVDLGKFTKPVNNSGRKGYAEKGGWVIEEDDGSKHGGSGWKLKTKKQARSGKKKDREATLDSNGKILRK